MEWTAPRSWKAKPRRLPPRLNLLCWPSLRRRPPQQQSDRPRQQPRSAPPVRRTRRPARQPDSATGPKSSSGASCPASSPVPTSRPSAGWRTCEISPGSTTVSLTGRRHAGCRRRSLHKGGFFLIIISLYFKFIFFKCLLHIPCNLLPHHHHKHQFVD